MLLIITYFEIYFDFFAMPYPLFAVLIPAYFQFNGFKALFVTQTGSLHVTIYG
jgi:hypothetical protein